MSDIDEWLVSFKTVVAVDNGPRAAVLQKFLDMYIATLSNTEQPTERLTREQLQRMRILLKRPIFADMEAHMESVIDKMLAAGTVSVLDWCMSLTTSL